MAIIDFAEDPALLNLTFSPAQRTLLRSFYGEALNGEETEIFRMCVGREYESCEYSELTCIAGARSGKDSRIATSIALYEAFCRDHSYLHIGERGFILIVAQDQRGGQTAFGYIKAAIEQSDLLSAHISDTRKTEIELDNNITIAVYPCSYRAPRGVTIICGIADEVSYWRDENSANPDREILRSLTRGMANVPNAKLVKISTPYSRSGALYDDFVRRHELPDTLVWKAPTWIMNPTISETFLNRERTKDPIAFDREYGAEFAEDITGFIQRDVLEGSIIRGRFEIPPEGRFRYVSFTDPSGGSSDSMVLAIAHGCKEQSGKDSRFVLDLLKEVRPPFSPEQVTAEFAADLRRYSLREVVGDRYGAGWVRERFKQHGITYRASNLTRSEIYLEFLPLLNSSRLELLDHPRLTRQLLNLERRVSRGNGRDFIDHRQGEHDDVANAAAGALVASAKRPTVQHFGIF